MKKMETELECLTCLHSQPIGRAIKNAMSLRVGCVFKKQGPKQHFMQKINSLTVRFSCFLASWFFFLSGLHLLSGKAADIAWDTGEGGFSKYIFFEKNNTFSYD